jgi:hypothetical protein
VIRRGVSAATAACGLTTSSSTGTRGLLLASTGTGLSVEHWNLEVKFEVIVTTTTTVVLCSSTRGPLGTNKVFAEQTN